MGTAFESTVSIGQDEELETARTRNFELGPHSVQVERRPDSPGNLDNLDFNSFFKRSLVFFAQLTVGRVNRTIPILEIFELFLNMVPSHFWHGVLYRVTEGKKRKLLHTSESELRNKK